MGFLDGLKAVGRAAGCLIEGIGEIVGSETIQELGRNIQDDCAKEIASEAPYDVSTADIYTTERLSDILTEMSRAPLEKATVLENRCINMVESFFDDEIIELIKAQKFSENKSELKQLERERSKIERKIKGTIRGPLAKRLSIDDKECCNILKMEAGDEKYLAMLNFSQKVTAEALAKLAKKVQEWLNENMESIQMHLTNIAEEKEKELKTKKNNLDELTKRDELERRDVENSCIVPLVVIYSSDMILSILE